MVTTDGPTVITVGVLMNAVGSVLLVHLRVMLLDAIVLVA